MLVKAISPYCDGDCPDYDEGPNSHWKAAKDAVGNTQATAEAYDKAHAAKVLEAAAREAALQAKIDALMLEHCPDEMMPEQLENWGRHQKPSPETNLDEALRKQ